MSCKPFKRPESVLVIVYTPALDVLLIERADFANGWQSVTGSMEDGETPCATACREIGEELGLVIGEADLDDWQISNHWEIYARWRHRYAPGVSHNLEHVFGLSLAQPIHPTLNPREHVAWQWMPHTDAIGKVFSPSNAEALRLLPQMARPTTA